MEEVFKNADISKGITVDGENLTSLRFVNDVALFNEKNKQMEKHLSSLNSESWPKNTHGKDKIHGKPCRYTN